MRINKLPELVNACLFCFVQENKINTHANRARSSINKLPIEDLARFAADSVTFFLCRWFKKVCLLSCLLDVWQVFFYLNYGAVNLPCACFSITVSYISKVQRRVLLSSAVMEEWCKIFKTFSTVNFDNFRWICKTSLCILNNSSMNTVFEQFITIDTIKTIFMRINQTFAEVSQSWSTYKFSRFLQRMCPLILWHIIICTEINVLFICYQISKLDWNQHSEELNGQYFLSFLACYDVLLWISFPGWWWNLYLLSKMRVGFQLNVVFLSGVSETFASDITWIFLWFHK